MDNSKKRPAEEQAPDDKLEKKMTTVTIEDEDIPNSVFDDEACSMLQNKQRLARSRNRDRELLLQIKDLIGDEETAKSISSVIVSVNVRGLFFQGANLRPEPIPESVTLEDVKNAVRSRLLRVIDKAEKNHGNQDLPCVMHECQAFIASLFAARPSKVPFDPLPAVKEAHAFGLPKFADFLSRVGKLLKETEKFYRSTH